MNPRSPGRLARAVGALSGNKTGVSGITGPRLSNLPSPATRPDSTIARAPSVGTTQGTSSNKLDLSTYITKVGETDQIYDGSRAWARVTLTLETAGPVVVGVKDRLTPVLGGQGVLLDTDVPAVFTISKGNKLYINSNAVSRVKVQIESYPWLEAITGSIYGIMQKMGLGGLIP